MDKLNCYECKEWFETKDLIYLPEERFYLCRPCGCTFYAKRSVALRAELAQARGERDEYKRQAKLYNDDMMKVRAQRDALTKLSKRLLDCFVVDAECDWWKPNPLTPMSARDTTLTELAAALKRGQA